MIVWLWDANGPASDASGITDDEEKARRIAENYMHTTKARTAKVESARTDIGIYTLTTCYERTGRGWLAKKRHDGHVTWKKINLT